MTDQLEKLMIMNERLRRAEVEKRDLQDAINTNVQTMQLLADRAKKAEAERDTATALATVRELEANRITAKLRQAELERNKALQAYQDQVWSENERIRSLEVTAQDLLDSLAEITADAMGILPERKRLAEVVERKCTKSSGK